jgi:subtilisin family serine protease
VLYALSRQTRQASGVRQFAKLLEEFGDYGDDEEEMKVLIGYKDSAVGGMGLQQSSSSSSSSSSSRTFKTGKGLSRVHAVRANLNRTALQMLESDPGILYIERDPKVAMLGDLDNSAHLAMINAMYTSIPTPSQSTSGACSDPNSFKIGIVDSGVDIYHPDIPCFNVGLSNANCIGTEFGVSDDEKWFSPLMSHGTMVTGLIGAIRSNSQGGNGVLSNTQVCYIVARVFGDDNSGIADLSDILEGIDWVFDQGAKVINLSLGGPATAITAENLYKSVRDGGALLIAAAGNDGSSQMSYPASYDTCVSVAAVDNELARAAFSQYNTGVDIAAPGVHVLSTSPLGIGGLAEMHFAGTSFAGSYFEGSQMSSKNISGPLLFCDLGVSICPGVSTGSVGHVCLIERGGEILFEDKALNCELGGGAAAVIFNNVDFELDGATLAAPTSVTIPVISLSQDTGNELLNGYIGQVVTISSVEGYSYADGTSFSAPFVAGAAAAIWQACPNCGADEVEFCLLDSALDLLPTGVDEYTGHGLLQVEEAYNCLVNDVQCCATVVSSVQGPSPVASTTSVPIVAPVSTIIPATQADVECATANDSYNACFDSELTVWEEEMCRFCINSAVPSDLRVADCSAIESALCPAIRGSCSFYCNPCSDEIEDYMVCAIQATNSGCDLKCPYDANTIDGGSNKGLDTSQTNSPANDSTGDDKVGLIDSDSGTPSLSPRGDESSSLRSASTFVTNYFTWIWGTCLAIIYLIT